MSETSEREIQSKRNEPWYEAYSYADVSDKERYEGIELDDFETTRLGRKYAIELISDETDPELAMVCRKFELATFKRFDEKKEGQDHSQILPEIYEGLEDKSRFVAVIDRRAGRLVGVSRFIYGDKPEDYVTVRDTIGKDGDKDSEEILDEIKEYHEDFNPKEALEISSIAVAEKYRGRKLLRPSTLLFYGVFRATKESQEREGRPVNHWVTMIRRGPYKQLRNYGAPMKPFCDSEEIDDYYGALNTQPAYMRIEDVEQVKGVMKRIIAHGWGITAVAKTFPGLAAKEAVE